jgi:putative transposase
MAYEANVAYHIYNQGNNGQKIFFKEENYLFFLKKMRAHLLPMGSLLAYCLMPNHFHWLFWVGDEGAKIFEGKGAAAYVPRDRLSHSIGGLLSSYTRAINIQNSASGSLFRAKTRHKNGLLDRFITTGTTVHGGRNLGAGMDNDYLATAFEYIHQNPVKAGLAQAATDWPFSSARDYAGLRNGTLCDRAFARELGLEWQGQSSPQWPMEARLGVEPPLGRQKQTGT